MSVKIESRKTWGAKYANGDLSLSNKAEGVYVHHTVTKHLPANASVAQERAQMRSIEAIGQSRFGFGISYNVIIFPSGRAYEGVSFNRRGAHTGGLNSVVRSICFAGNYEINKPTDAAIATASKIFSEGKNKWWVKSPYLKGHRDQVQTACPGKYVYARLNDIKNGVEAPKPVTKPSPKPTPKPVKKPSNGFNLKVDGEWGKATTEALQEVFNTPVDGVISQQVDYAKNYTDRLWAAEFSKKKKLEGSSLIFAMQKWLGIKEDGLAGPKFIKALQKEMGTPVDGFISENSQMVMEMQRRLNAGNLK